MTVMERIATEVLVSHEITESGESPRREHVAVFTYESGLIVQLTGGKGGRWSIVHDPKV